MDLEAIDRITVRYCLEKWPCIDTAARLAEMGYDKGLVREEFRRALEKLYIDVPSLSADDAQI